MTAGTFASPATSFASLVPARDDPAEAALRGRLGHSDRKVRGEAALRLGAAYLGASPEVATRLLMQAVADGSPLTAARALLRLARHARTHRDVPTARHR